MHASESHAKALQVLHRPDKSTAVDEIFSFAPSFLGSVGSELASILRYGIYTFRCSRHRVT
jgi:hypothetical protein